MNQVEEKGEGEGGIGGGKRKGEGEMFSPTKREYGKASIVCPSEGCGKSCESNFCDDEGEDDGLIARGV